MSEELAILDEISEEVKRDQFVKFVQKNQNIITGAILAVVAGIFMYTSWKKQNAKELNNTCRALFQAIHVNEGEKRLFVLEEMAKNAPARLLPVVQLIRSGFALSDKSSAEEHKKICQQLLELAGQNGLEVEWRDLAVLVYVSHSNDFEYKKLIDMLLPLTEVNRPFRLSAKELIGSLYAANGQKLDAARVFDQIISDSSAPAGMVERCKIVRMYIGS